MSAPGLFDLLAAARAYRAGGPGPKATLLAVVERVGQVDGEWVCWPSMATVAHDSEQSAGTVRRHLAEFEKRGLLERRSRGAEGGGRGSNLLVLNVPELLQQTAHGVHFGADQSAHPGGGKARTQPDQSAHPAQVAPYMEHPQPPVTTSNTAPTFDDFYAAYPLHNGPGAARKAWAKAITKADPAAIVAGAARYRDDPNRDPAYTAYPATWLNAERWADEPLRPRAQQRGARQPERLDTDRTRPSEMLVL